ncbi:MAG: enoyl-CoA hydratase/isomerase family protein [Desulfobacteraceae bacterium]|nr:enoyl-CoA hydratase/isomerase family protein [Desulfobacteraceae bacterium]
MEKNLNSTISHEFFTSETINNIALLEFQEFPLKRIVDLQEKEKIFAYLRNIATDKNIKLLLILNSSHKMEKESYINFIKSSIETNWDMTEISCLYNAINQFILKIINFEKLIIHVDDGVVIPPFLNISLACDYRIVGDKTIFRNPNIELDLPPKGGGVFFLSKKLGHSKTIEFLMSEKDITAKEAQNLGIINRIAASDNLKQEAINIAQEFAKKPVHFMSGIKQLLNWNFDEIKAYLEYENEILLNFIKSSRY